VNPETIMDVCGFTVRGMFAAIETVMTLLAPGVAVLCDTFPFKSQGRESPRTSNGWLSTGIAEYRFITDATPEILVIGNFAIDTPETCILTLGEICGLEGLVICTWKL